MSFDDTAHTFKYPGLESILKHAVKFFAQTPVHHLPPSYQFTGPGVYGLYYVGDFALYAPVAGPELEKPIYIGKAVPPGARTARPRNSVSSNLIGRLREHAKSIDIAANLKVEDFRCRFMIMDNVERDLIVPVESELIRTYLPLWNLYVSGYSSSR